MPDAYLNLAIKRQALLERLKSGQVRQFSNELRKLERLIRKALIELDKDISEATRRELDTLIRKLRKDQGAVFTQATNSFLKDSSKIAALTASQEVIDLEKTIDLGKTSLKDFTQKEVFSKVVNRPLSTNGNLLKPILDKLKRDEIERISGAIRQGWANGKTNQQLISDIVGTKKTGVSNTEMQKMRRSMSTVVRTSTQHVASSARHEIWEANRDIIDKYEFVATLDRSTSEKCRNLDEEIFEFGKGPIPPIHPNCRSTHIPVLNDEYSFLSKGRTRSTEGGPVSANKSYYEWLKTQSKQAQAEVLGSTKAKLFRDGGLTVKKFKELQFDSNFEPLTLKEMQKISPQAFKKAGIELA